MAAPDRDFTRRRANSDRLRTNNKVQLETADYAVHVHDVWLFYADASGKMVPDKAKADHQRVKITLTLDDFEGVVLGEEIPVKLDPRSRYTARMTSMSGPMDEEKLADFDPLTLKGLEAYASVKCEERTPKANPEKPGEVLTPYHWSSVVALRPREVKVAKPRADAQQPAQPAASATPAVAAARRDRPTLAPRESLENAQRQMPPAHPEGSKPTDLQARWIRRFRVTFEIDPRHVAAMTRRITARTAIGPRDEPDKLTSPESRALCEALVEHVSMLLKARNA